MDVMDQYYKNMVEVEIALANKSPVLEAEYQLDRPSAISLYDSLVPQLKHLARSKPAFEREHIEQRNKMNRE